MRIYNTQKEIEADIVDGVLRHDGDIKITFNCIIEANVDVYNIDALNFDAVNISANNITAHDIKADNINARNISYYAFCISHGGIKCTGHQGRRVNHIIKALDGEITIKETK